MEDHTVYIVAYEDYDGSDQVGYFIDEDKAKECRDYLNRARPSHYNHTGDTWDIIKFNLDETDYRSLNKKLDEEERLEFENRMEQEKQKELAELARLKAKYEN